MQAHQNIDLLKLTKVRELKVNDAPAILSLVKSVFDNNYTDKEFYNIKIIESYLKKINEKGEGVWKGVFLGKNLIGMMLAILEGNILLLKMTMVDTEYTSKGVITELGPHMLKEIPRFKQFNVKSIFAFVNNNDLPILKTLIKFGCINFGKTPYFEESKCYLIYGLIVFDHRKHLISPHYKLQKYIEKTIRETKLNRKIVENKLLTSIIINKTNYNLKIKNSKKDFPINYQIFNDNILCANFSENKYNYTWYNFTFSDNISIEIKALILKKIIKLFYNREKIKSFSLTVEINDVILQEILLDLGFKYYAFLPFYYSNKDAILLGLSKIKTNNIGI